MRWDELDLKDGAWSIPAEKTKTRRAQIIPLGPIELEVLKGREQLLEDTGGIDDDCPWVFAGKGASGHMVDPGNAWETLREKLKMGDLWLHDLRRSLASSMANTGADVSIVRAALNHTDTRTTLKAYIRTSQEVQLQAKQKAQEAWLEAKKRQQAEEADAGDEPAPTKKKPSAIASKAKRSKKKKQ